MILPLEDSVLLQGNGSGDAYENKATNRQDSVLVHSFRNPMHSERVSCSAMKRFPWTSRVLIVLAGLVGQIGTTVAGETAAGGSAGMKEFLQDLLPTAWQKHPLQRYSVITEM